MAVGAGGRAVSPGQPTALEFDRRRIVAAACKVRISSYRPNRQECCMPRDDRGSMAARFCTEAWYSVCCAEECLPLRRWPVMPASHVESSMIIRSHLEGSVVCDTWSGG